MFSISYHFIFQCAVIPCYSRILHNIECFRFPTDDAARKLWLDALRGHELCSSNYLCINHFKSSQLKKAGNRRVLVSGAIPELELGEQFETVPLAGTSSGSEQTTSHQNTQSELDLADLDDSECSELNQNQCNLFDTDKSSNCSNCSKLETEIKALESFIVKLKSENSIQVATLQNYVKVEKEKSLKHAQEKKSLKTVLDYHKNNETKLKAVIKTLTNDNILTAEAVADLNVI